MSENLFKLFTTSYSTNVELTLQQMGSKLRGRTREGTHVGKLASPINQVGAISMKAPAGRFAPKNRTDADMFRRWVQPIDREMDQLIDTFDELKTIVDPKSVYVENGANAVGRFYDDVVIQAATAASVIGTDNSSLTTEPFDTTNFQIADSFGASSATGLTVAKLIEVKRKMRKAHVDFENDPLTLVIGSQQEADLLKQVQVVSTDFNDRPVLVDGKVARFLGFDIVVSERLTQTTANTTRGCLAFVKSGLYLGVWQDQVNRISIRNDLASEPYDLYTKCSAGATRTQQGKVVQILCADTTGADTPAS